MAEEQKKSFQKENEQNLENMESLQMNYHHLVTASVASWMSPTNI